MTFTLCSASLVVRGLGFEFCWFVSENNREEPNDLNLSSNSTIPRSCTNNQEIKAKIQGQRRVEWTRGLCAGRQLPDADRVSTTLRGIYWKKDN